MQLEGVSLRKPKTCLILDSFVCFVFSKFQRQISETEAWQAERKKRRVVRPSGTSARGRILAAPKNSTMPCH